jgi:hypothetical protein
MPENVKVYKAIDKDYYTEENQKLHGSHKKGSLVCNK